MINYEKLGIMNQKGHVLTMRTIATKIARKNAPKDTGNMAMNGIYSMATSFGFRVVWDSNFAYYMPFVNEDRNYINSEKTAKNKGFVDRAMVEICDTLKNYSLGEPINNIKYKSSRHVSNLIPLVFNENEVLRIANKQTNQQVNDLVSLIQSGNNVGRFLTRVKQNIKYNVIEPIEDATYYKEIGKAFGKDVEQKDIISGGDVPFYDENSTSLVKI